MNSIHTTLACPYYFSFCLMPVCSGDILASSPQFRSKCAHLYFVPNAVSLMNEGCAVAGTVHGTDERCCCCCCCGYRGGVPSSHCVPVSISYAAGNICNACGVCSVSKMFSVVVVFRTVQGIFAERKWNYCFAAMAVAGPELHQKRPAHKWQQRR